MHMYYLDIFNTMILQTFHLNKSKKRLFITSPALSKTLLRDPVITLHRAAFT